MRIEVNGVRLFFDVVGPKFVADGPRMREKPTLIVLPGGPDNDHSSLKPYFDRAADVAQVLYLDIRGVGRSDRCSVEYWNLAQWADDLKALCDALEISKPIIFGTSAGGMIAQSYALRYPQHPGKLILSSTQACRNVERSVAAFERLAGAEVAAVAAVARRYFEAPGAETGAAYLQHCMPQYWRRATPDADAARRAIRNRRLQMHFMQGEHTSFDFLTDLSRIACNTLVHAGEDDPVCPIGDAEDLVAALPQHLVRFERFAGCGHFLRFEDPERTMRSIRDFILS